jgi:predicted DNA-binding transcriptional regulator AlpA
MRFYNALMNTPNKILTVKEVAGLLGLSVSAIHSLC